jgi:large subunit ribosomal protein L23
MRLLNILKKPLQTEKTSNVEMNNNTYTFAVSSDATKIDIKKAVHFLYGVDAADVNIVNTREKFKYGKKRSLQLKRRTYKKAYVTLRDAKAKIDFSVIK